MPTGDITLTFMSKIRHSTRYETSDEGGGGSMRYDIRDIPTSKLHVKYYTWVIDRNATT